MTKGATEDDMTAEVRIELWGSSVWNGIAVDTRRLLFRRYLNYVMVTLLRVTA